MRTSKFYCSLILIVLVSLSCENEVQYTPVVYKDVSITLNDGNKWKIPPQMKVYMDSSFLIIDQMAKEKPVDEKSVTSLVHLKNEFVSNCSVEGKGHDMLHSWLMPYMDILESLGKAKTTEEKMQAKAELIEAKRIFVKYFE